jgi:hypothetical protein
MDTWSVGSVKWRRSWLALFRSCWANFFSAASTSFLSFLCSLSVMDLDWLSFKVVTMSFVVRWPKPLFSWTFYIVKVFWNKGRIQGDLLFISMMSSVLWDWRIDRTFDCIQCFKLERHGSDLLRNRRSKYCLSCSFSHSMTTENKGNNRKLLTGRAPATRRRRIIIESFDLQNSTPARPVHRGSVPASVRWYRGMYWELGLYVPLVTKLGRRWHGKDNGGVLGRYVQDAWFWE